MKPASIKELKDELSTQQAKELLNLCLQLAKFKKENKELLTYLLFEASDEASYIESVKKEIDNDFAEINTRSYYFIKKSVRKILRNIKKYIRYSKKKETEVELLIYCCAKLKKMKPAIGHNVSLTNIFIRQVSQIKKCISSLHEDLQFDYGDELDEILK